MFAFCRVLTAFRCYSGQASTILWSRRQLGREDGSQQNTEMSHAESTMTLQETLAVCVRNTGISTARRRAQGRRNWHEAVETAMLRQKLASGSSDDDDDDENNNNNNNRLVSAPDCNFLY